MGTYSRLWSSGLGLLLVALLAAGPAWTGLDKARQAYQQGDYATALREARPLAEQGHADAQAFLAGMYFLGKGVRQDYAQAALWMRKAAAQGHAAAQNSLGAMYRDNLGVRQDYGQAVEWFRKAAAQGSADAQTSLGVAYFEGKEVRQDYGQAVEWLRKAAAQGHVLAQHNLQALAAANAATRPQAASPQNPLLEQVLRNAFPQAASPRNPLLERAQQMQRAARDAASPHTFHPGLVDPYSDHNRYWNPTYDEKRQDDMERYQRYKDEDRKHRED